MITRAKKIVRPSMVYSPFSSKIYHTKKMSAEQTVLCLRQIIDNNKDRLITRLVFFFKMPFCG
jgi:hypothetical protein